MNQLTPWQIGLILDNRLVAGSNPHHFYEFKLPEPSTRLLKQENHDVRIYSHNKYISKIVDLKSQG